MAVVSNGTAVWDLVTSERCRQAGMEGKGLLFKASPISTYSTSRSTGRMSTSSSRRSRPSRRPLGHQPRGHQGPRVLRDRGAPGQGARHPVMHDDQHGTAIISGAALLNGLEVVEKESASLRWSSREPVPLQSPGPPLHQARSETREHDSRRLQGHPDRLTQGAGELNEYKAEFARDIPDGGLDSALEGPTCSSDFKRGETSVVTWSPRWLTAR
ncbi:MAG: hypothetical protein CM1200mP32_10410 [Methanobacteriota archaeon]|nr:MAG: hypothetical protein CM1200mP32_10410 [Euryarchaeota archaeon]